MMFVQCVHSNDQFYSSLCNSIIYSYAKQLIEETIRRNASPVRLDETGIGGAGSCNSLASSGSDEVQPRANRNTITSTNMTSPMAIAGQSAFAVSNQSNQYAIQGELTIGYLKCFR